MNWNQVAKPLVHRANGISKQNGELVDNQAQGGLLRIDKGSWGGALYLDYRLRYPCSKKVDQISMFCFYPALYQQILNAVRFVLYP